MSTCSYTELEYMVKILLEENKKIKQENRKLKDHIDDLQIVKLKLKQEIINLKKICHINKFH
jgi:regulator of replication initiation timing